MKNRRILSIAMALALSLSLALPTAAARVTTVDELFTQVMPTRLETEEFSSTPMPSFAPSLAPSFSMVANPGLSSATADLAAANSTPEPTAIPANGTITIKNNAATSGVCIDSKTFDAYLIVEPETYTAYAVTENFKGFFTGVMVGGDNKSYDFSKEGITDHEYDILAGKYMDSFLSSSDKTKSYEFARAVRQYIDDNDFAPNSSATVAAAGSSDPSDHGEESATFENLSMGYYFVMCDEFTTHGLGVAADGAFVPVVDSKSVEIAVKGSIPTVAKEIWHDDLADNAGAWDIVGDSQIGETVKFRITSTIPSDVKVYQDLADPFYHYYLSDTMSEGLTLNADSIKVYTDSKMNTELGAEYYEVYLPGDADYPTDLPANIDSAKIDFLVVVDVLALADDQGAPTVGTIYTGYNAILNADAVVAFDESDPNYDTNTIELTYSNDPDDNAQFGHGDDSVTHFTFEFGVLKVSEENKPLAGATFEVKRDGTALQLVSHGLKTFHVDGKDATVDAYTIAPPNYVLEDGETLVTQIVTTEASGGRFVVRGINDSKSYVLEEVAAPEGYNLAQPVQFKITATYDSTGTKLITINDDSDSVVTGMDSIKITIINVLRVVLPSTGGVGTVIFQVTGLSLMLCAAAFLLMGRRTKAKRQM